MGRVLERPDLSDAVVAGYAREGWGLAVAELSFMPVGYDARAWAYEVRTGTGERYFLKLRQGGTSQAAALVPRYLVERGLSQVVAPLATVAGEPWLPLDGYEVLLYPFIDEDRSIERLAEDQWIEYGAFLGALHGTPVPERLAVWVPAERYACGESEGVRALSVHARQGSFADPWQRELAGYWREHEAEILDLADRTDRLARLAEAERVSNVLCHADIHPGNILIDRKGGLHVVDWDAPVLAPRERDLQFVLDGPGEEPFRRGYGPLEVNRIVLAYLRHARVVEDLDAFARHAFFEDIGAETKKDDLRWVRVQLAPGGPADMARATLD